MRFRLVGRLRDRTLRLPLQPGLNRIGGSPESDVHLDDPTVSRSHAEIEAGDDDVLLRDLDSRNGTFVDDRRVTTTRVAPGAMLAFGQVRLRLEPVSDADLVAGVSFADVDDGAAAATDGSFSTIRTKPLESFVIDRLPALLSVLEQGRDVTVVAQAVGASLFETLPVLSVEIASGPGILFAAAREIEARDPEIDRVGDDRICLTVSFPDGASRRAFQPLLASAVTLVRIAQRAGASAPSDPPASRGTPRFPEPPSVVPAVQRVYQEAARIARGTVGVLITGESGTGKEVLARFLHAASSRADGPFVALNCAALPRDLLETELFGIERGVATGVDARPGRFELASGGTLFLDEIGDMALETQAKILRVLQEGTVHRIGGTAARKADVRVVSATNRDMRALLQSRQFREDLYYRIATWRVELPALRQRRGDIPNLAAYFLERAASRSGLRVRGISQAALDRLVAYDWPGNVRQLENEIARCVLFLGDGELLDSAMLGPDLRGDAPPPTTLAEILERAERDAISEALAAGQGDVEQAATRLGMARSTLYRRIKALGLG